MNRFKDFTINSVSKRINRINASVTLSHQRPFPNLCMLSRYRFKKRFVNILPNGAIEGGLCRMITSLIDFSFIRSLVADCYSPMGPPCYDPVSLFLLELFRHIDGYKDMSQFCEVLHDNERGRAYRAYAGLRNRIPCKGTFSHFKIRLGEARFNEIFHILVNIFHRLGMISMNILAHDGTLYSSWSRYKGCTYFSEQCSCIKVEDVINKVRSRILYRLNNMAKHNLGSEVRVYTECPSTCFPEDVEKPKIELFAFKLAAGDGELSQEQRNTAKLFDVYDELERQGLCINTLRSNVTGIDACDGSITIKCPKLPADTDARIGVRRNPQNPDKLQKIFGYNLVLTTSVELFLKLELPVAVTTISGNAEEGSQLITNRNQISAHHTCVVKIDIADAKYDIIHNYDYIRQTGSIPVIDYNPRNEKLRGEDLVARGYDQKGVPFAPCGLLCRQNGFDKKHLRLTFCCFKQCLTLRKKALMELQGRFDISACPHIPNKTGFAKHMYIKEHPRLVNEIPRGSKRYDEIKKLRSASERSNSTLKEDIKILHKPRVLKGNRASILSQLSAIVLLLFRAFSFIAKTTCRIRNFFQGKDHKEKKYLNPFIPKSILRLIQVQQE